MTDVTREGGCQCGAIRYRVTGEPVFTAICHCTMCRRANAAPAVAWAMFPNEQLALTKGEPTIYKSSPDAERGFCAKCGSQINFRAEYIPGLVDLTIGSLDDPEGIRPSMHYWDTKRLSWVVFDDELPKYPEFPPVD